MVATRVTTGQIFDGYTGWVGMMTSMFVFVASATHYLEMRCDDVPDQFYSLLFVLIPEG